MTEFDPIGYIGVFILLVAFFLSSMKLIFANGAPHLLMNLIGGLLACKSSYDIQFWPFVIMEGTWSLVALGGLVAFYAQRLKPELKSRGRRRKIHA